MLFGEYFERNLPMWDLNKARVLHTTETHITVKKHGRA